MARIDKLFWSYFLLYLDFTLALGIIKINLVPDWAGYLLLLSALKELQQESPLFRQPQIWCTVLAIYSGLLWIGDLTGVAFNPGGWLLGLAATCLQLYITLRVIDGIADVEQFRACDLGSGPLHKVWGIAAVGSLASYILVWIPPLSGICALISGISTMVILGRLNTTRKLWRTYIGI
ncbi:MAG: hypothetical protein E7457_02940 [Ruminococcaceae bacterium]|nr:hypothetical protein [Oscillospiraceae bacterium]